MFTSFKSSLPSALPSLWIRWFTTWYCFYASFVAIQFVQCTEIVATYEWQAIRANDTLPAGLEIRIDMTTGEKWARLEPITTSFVKDSTTTQYHHNTKKHCDEACQERQRNRREAGHFLRGGSSDHRLETPPVSFVSSLNTSLVVKLILILILGVIVALRFHDRVGKRSWWRCPWGRRRTTHAC